jgi:hypothetical protein
LPGAFAVASHGEARLVAGPAGAFVMLPVADPAQPADASFTLSQLAADTRSSLADHLSWVPFIDTLLVSLNGARDTRNPSVVPLDLVHDTVCEGRQVVDDRALGVIQDLLRRGMLGDWRVGLIPADARIDLCSPDPSPAAETAI